MNNEIILVVDAKYDTKQAEFEMKLHMCFGIKPGCLAINLETNQYCNSHIQWLWEANK